MQETRKTIFAEKLYPSASFTLSIQVLPVAFWLISLPLWPVVAPFIGLATEIVLLAVTFAGAAKTTFDGTELRVGKACIQREMIGEIEVLRGQDAQRARTSGLNPRAWLLLRPGINSYLKVVITDPNDSTPYWLFSSRRPEELAKALRARLSAS